MRAMKDSGIEWIGKIPQDWQIAKVKHVYSFQTGWTPSTSNAAYFDGDLPWANISDIGKTKTIYDTAKHITEEAVANSSMGISPKGSLMYSFKLSVGDVSFCGTDMYTNEAIATFLPSDKYDLRYLYYAAPLFIIKNANENIYGAKLLNQELIRNALILNPPYNEQVSVADYLDAKCAEIDALIAAKEKTNALLKERRQSIIYEAVTKGLNPDAPMKDSGIEWIGEIPVHWEVERLKHHIEFNPKTEIPEYGEDDSVSFIPMDCLRRGVHTSQTVDYSKVKSGYVDFAEGDILMAKVTPCLENGNLAIAGNLIDGVGFGSTEINVIRCKSIHREYLFYILQCKTYVDRAVADMYGVAGLKRLNPSFIPNTKYPMPSIEEQQGIAEHLAATCGEIDELVVANERTIEKLKEYRQSVIYEAVTGKIEV